MYVLSLGMESYCASAGLVEINSQLVNSLVHISTMIPLHALSVQRLVQTAMVLSSRTDLLDTASIQSLTSLLTRLAVRSDSVQALPVCRFMECYDL